MRYPTFRLLACALLMGSASAQNSQTEVASSNTEQPDATVTLSGGSVAAGIGFVWGRGDLVFAGQKHRFKLSGLSIVDVGAASITASGVVYNLKHLSDFDGNYTAATAGLTVAGGGSVAILRNEHGVVIRMLSTTAGLRFNLSANGITIHLRS
jgi:hypothetical protein